MSKLFKEMKYSDFLSQNRQELEEAYADYETKRGPFGIVRFFENYVSYVAEKNKILLYDDVGTRVPTRIFLY